MKVESTKIGDVPVLILWFNSIEESIPFTTELWTVTDSISKGTCQTSSGRIVFGIDVFQKLSVEKADQFSELMNSYYRGQVGPGKGIVFSRL